MDIGIGLPEVEIGGQQSPLECEDALDDPCDTGACFEMSNLTMLLVALSPARGYLMAYIGLDASNDQTSAFSRRDCLPDRLSNGA